ncbi:hydroxymethylglutaryl-CoA lyase [Bradyrhizobium diversitatis]|uniref:Hydroxymethylglutaryl-CoA lyase n=1 Tax=Bradyrhizobium diversitatis TaxID=2755406 RepID=A0ABS0PBJ4_9BRAD|nr:hydroxymethylglutaryl-CoA lyase [Bradyrhizobium diversitatis]MBH5390672.1 hydroxymethylglutaryl-CoA lyase [Bradyrhizobium diversitatis]
MSTTTAYRADGVTLREVALRDGLQLVKAWPTTSQKLEWLVREHSAGVTHFEVGSFLPANRAPQFADIRELLSCVTSASAIHTSALAMNERGIDEALTTQVSEIACVVSATEAHSHANIRRSRDQSIELVRYAAKRRLESNHGALISVGIAMSFGCSIAGPVQPAEVLKIAEACLSAGADLVGIADTVGFAGPNQVYELSAALHALVGSGRFVVHLHDTRGLGIANASAALDAGCRVLDGSLGGLGGCPFAPGATGNVVFEDLVYLCETKGFRTGIDIDALIDVRRTQLEAMPEERLYGAIARSGVPKNIDWAAGGELRRQ